MMDLFVSYSHWGMFPCWTYPLEGPTYHTGSYVDPEFASYDAKYLHG